MRGRRGTQFPVDVKTGWSRIRSAWSPPADEQLFGPEQERRMLVALLAVGIVLGIPGLVASAAGGSELGLVTELALLTGKLACVAWLTRTRVVSDAATSAIVAFNTLCVAVGNFVFPGDFRPITAQLLLAVLFVSWFLVGRRRAAQLVLLGLACVVTVVSADPQGPEALRVATLLVTGIAIAATALALRDRYERLERQATTDALTGIGNRRAFEQAAASALAHAERFGESLALMLIDLDGFKDVNDELGHPAGDAELISVANRLSRRARAQDAVFRIGGDEFAMLLPGTSAAGAAQLSEELTSRSRARIGSRTTLSAGVAEFPAHARTVECLTRAADEALLAAKRDGKAQVAVAARGAAGAA
jgi:diguanylate cyclase (GGDEF)-like protein